MWKFPGPRKGVYTIEKKKKKKHKKIRREL